MRRRWAVILTVLMVTSSLATAQQSVMPRLETLLNKTLAAHGRRDFAAAMGHATDAIELLEPTAGRESEFMAMFLTHRGRARVEGGQYEAAREDYSRAQSILVALQDRSPMSLYMVGSNIADLKLRTNDVEGARDDLSRLLPLATQFGPSESARIASALASAHALLDNQREALALYANAIVGIEASLDISPNRAVTELQLATVLDNYSVLLLELGDLEAALRTTERALAIRIRLIPGSRETGVNHINKATIETQMGKNEEAASSFEQALHILTPQLPLEHRAAVMARTNAAQLYVKTGNSPRAAEILAPLIECEQCADQIPACEYGLALHTAGLYEAQLQRWSRAEDLLTRSMRVRITGCSHNVNGIASTLNALGWTALVQGQHDDALEKSTDALSWISSRSSPWRGSRSERVGIRRDAHFLRLDALWLMTKNPYTLTGEGHSIQDGP